MSWTSQATVVAGQLMTAAFWNTYVRDDETYLFDFSQNILSNLPFYFGGSAAAPTVNTTFPSGATLDKLAPDTGVFSCPASLPAGTYKLEAILAAEGGATVSLELVNLTDAPDTAVVTITSTSATGQKVQSSTVTLVASKDFGVKRKSSSAASRAWAWAIRLVRIT
jgi:hypothetical protein